MYSRKNSAPKIEPCGMPHVNNHLDKKEFCIYLEFFSSIFNNKIECK